MELLLKFEYENKWYGILKDNDKIKYCIINGDKYNFTLSKEEIELIDSILGEFSPSDKRIKLMDYELGNTTYQVLLDPKTNIRHFLPKPSDNDLYELNMLFNNMDECVYDADEVRNEQDKKDDSKLVKRIVKHGKKLVIVFVSAVVLFTGVKGTIDNYNNNIRYENNEIATEYTKSLSIEDILKIVNNALARNKNLSAEEKARILECLPKELFLANKDSIDIKYIENALERVSIHYDEDIEYRSGNYNRTLHRITFYGVNKLSDVSRATFAHELYHVLQNNSFPDYNLFLTETTNTIFCEEFCERDNNIYMDYYNYTKALMEIIGSEPFKQYHNYNLIRLVSDPLVAITGTQDDALKLLSNLDDYAKLYKKIVWENGTQKDKIALSTLKDDIVSQIQKYYFAKYNTNADDDMLMLYYLKPEVFNEKLKEVYGLSLGQEFMFVNNRKYFNNQSEDANNNVDIYIANAWYCRTEDNMSCTRYFNYYVKKIVTYNYERDDEEWILVSKNIDDMTEEESHTPRLVFSLSEDNRYVDISSNEIDSSSGKTI